ncbi:MAG: ABC transporter ATP-binding protein [Stappia sp.]|uniref:ABC transporter ATP-binding protein n=1 Tax=Stappia sp. TaxID=1870903 RepID=UPI000C5EE5F9|nr:ABC transporter ATP-binding protein [Stappia sp.]MAA99683.1 ABC transporter ATP-binding protein [Stappia sp.]MBM20118.1 ABC transporter ATP-binding protein [Stappia sp.]
MRKRLEAWLFADADGAPALIRRLVTENARAFAPLYALAFVCMGLVAATTGASAWVLKDVINEIFVARDGAMVIAIAVFVLVVFLVKGAASYGQLVILGRIGNAIVAQIQRRLFNAITSQDVAFFESSGIGDLGTRLSHNANAARAALDLVVTALGRDLLSVIALVGVMVLQDPLMSVIALVIAPPAIIVVSKLVRRVRRVAKSQFVSLSRILSISQETISGIRIVKAFAVEQRLRDEMGQAVADVETQANKITRLSARTSPVMETLGGMAIALVILYGGYSVIELGSDPGSFVSFIAALLLAYDPARRLARLNVNLSAHLVGVRLMYEVLDRETGERDTAPDAPLRLGEGRVTFDDVVFRYGEAPALDHLVFEARPGEVTALVGPSGAGKSTVFAMLERFHDPLAGRVLIDGTDIREAGLQSLRAQIALVSQDTFLFDLSVRDNIAIGRPGASEDDIRQAAREANAEEFILGLDGGYDASVGEGGGRLSGGQRQRVAIARAILRDAPILLLDEATSALDSESEAKIQEALSRLMKGRTTLVIAHRLATVREADQIVVMDKGRVVERGTHAALVAEGGLYKRLCDLQFNDKNAS